MLVKPWNPELDIHTETIVSLPIWVGFPSLELKDSGLKSLSKLGSILGVPLKTDQHTKEKAHLQYARVLIDINLATEFPDYIEFLDDQDVLIRQPVTYEWKLTRCDHCQMYDHVVGSCRKDPT